MCTTLPFAASCMEPLRPSTWGPTLRGHFRVRIFSPASPARTYRRSKAGCQPNGGQKEEALLGSQRDLAGILRAGFTEQMLGSLGRADSEEPCKCLFPTADLPWLWSEGSCFASTLGPLHPSACLPVYPQAASLTRWFIYLFYWSFFLFSSFYPSLFSLLSFFFFL